METVVEEVEVVDEVTLQVTFEATVEDVEAAKEAYRQQMADECGVPLTWIVFGSPR